ncbi:hypothetical protein BD309DRAFT_827668, partial [Dichomitus squalens]
TLRSFALTCRKLLSRTRSRLFSVICLKTQGHYLCLCDLSDNTPALCPLIYTVTIGTKAIWDADGEMCGTARTALLLHEIVPAALLAQLPNLRHW